MVGYLEMLKLPYTGCNSRGMLLGRDKSLTKTCSRTTASRCRAS